MKTAALTVPATNEFVRVASQFILQTARQLDVPAVSSPLFEVAIVEALANAVKHGSRQRGDATVSCEVERTPTGMTIRILDDGEGFEPPPAVPPPDLSLVDVSALPESGYGIPIIRTVFQSVQARRVGDRFCLELTLASELPLA